MFCTRLANGGLFPTGDPIVPFVISPRFECLNKRTHTHILDKDLCSVDFVLFFNLVCTVPAEMYRWSLGDGDIADVGSDEYQYCHMTDFTDGRLISMHYGELPYRWYSHMIPAPDVVEETCAVILRWGYFIDLGNYDGTCVSDPMFCISGGFTWSIWLKMFYISHYYVLRNVISSGHYGDYKSNFNLWITEDLNYLYCSAYNNNTRISTGINITDSRFKRTWIHIACSFDFSVAADNGTAKAYINGAGVEGKYLERFDEEYAIHKAPYGYSNMSLGDARVGFTAAFSNLVLTDGILGDEEIQHVYSCGSMGE